MTPRRHLLVLITLLLANTTPIAAQTHPNQPATRPAPRVGPTWHAQIQPYFDPLPPEEPREDTFIFDDPANVWLLRPFSTIDTREGAFKFLLTTTTFEGGVVGGGATRSHRSRAFALLVKQPDAPALFRDLLDRAQTAGKLYALCGLREAGAAREFDQHVKPFLRQPDDVTVLYQWGCVPRDLPVARLAEQIQSGETARDLLRPYARFASPPPR
jgi:hypothetical protein